MAEVGDLVVNTYSKATQLKRKLYRVVHRQPFGSGLVVQDSFGKNHEEQYGYHYVSLERYEELLDQRVRMAEVDVVAANRRVEKQKSFRQKFKSEKSLARTWFPKV